MLFQQLERVILSVGNDLILQFRLQGETPGFRFQDLHDYLLIFFDFVYSAHLTMVSVIESTTMILTFSLLMAIGTVVYFINCS